MGEWKKGVVEGEGIHKSKNGKFTLMKAKGFREDSETS